MHILLLLLLLQLSVSPDAHCTYRYILPSIGNTIYIYYYFFCLAHWTLYGDSPGFAFLSFSIIPNLAIPLA